jgi:hypothetical protein
MSKTTFAASMSFLFTNLSKGKAANDPDRWLKIPGDRIAG